MKLFRSEHILFRSVYLSIAVALSFLWILRLDVVGEQMQSIGYGVPSSVFAETMVSVLMLVNSVLGYSYCFRFRKWIVDGCLPGRVIPESWNNTGLVRKEIIKQFIMVFCLFAFFLFLYMKEGFAEIVVWGVSAMLLFAFGTTSIQFTVYSVCFCHSSMGKDS